jgi:hypothetical protein
MHVDRPDSVFACDYLQDNPHFSANTSVVAVRLKYTAQLFYTGAAIHTAVSVSLFSEGNHDVYL